MNASARSASLSLRGYHGILVANGNVTVRNSVIFKSFLGVSAETNFGNATVMLVRAQIAGA